MMLSVNSVVLDDTTYALVVVGIRNRSEGKKSGKGDHDMNECKELARSVSSLNSSDEEIPCEKLTALTGTVTRVVRVLTVCSDAGE